MTDLFGHPRAAPRARDGAASSWRVTIVAFSDRAYQLARADGGEGPAAWFPAREIVFEEDVPARVGAPVDVSIPDWLATDRGWT